MKCDELKAETIVPQGSAITLQMCQKGEADAALAAKDKEIAELESNERRLKRALYKACANWAMAESYSVLNDVPTANRWIHTLRKLEKKLEKYK